MVPRVVGFRKTEGEWYQGLLVLGETEEEWSRWLLVLGETEGEWY